MSARFRSMSFVVLVWVGNTILRSSSIVLKFNKIVLLSKKTNKKKLQQVQILVVAANIQMRTLKAKVDKGQGQGPRSEG